MARTNSVLERSNQRLQPTAVGRRGIMRGINRRG